MEGHRGSHSPENHQATWCAGKRASTPHSGVKNKSFCWMPVRGLQKPSESHVQGKGCGQGVGCVHPALWSLESKAPVVGSLTPMCTSESQDRVCFLTSTCVTFTPWPLVNPPAQFLAAQSRFPSTRLSGCRPCPFSPPGFCTERSLCLQHASPRLWARRTPLHPPVQRSACSAPPQGAFPDSRSCTGLPPGPRTAAPWASLL